MTCYYCDLIRSVDEGYAGKPAEYDLGSKAPRCRLHWRYRCAHCGAPTHFMATAFCKNNQAFFCQNCALESEEIEIPFWTWKYSFRYRSPWTGEWADCLDRLEFEGRHPLQKPGAVSEILSAISEEPYLTRYPVKLHGWRPAEDLSDAEIRSSWNDNADRWDAAYDEDGDPNRRYMSDPPMLEFLGQVEGLEILDLGCGNGYLCRKLANQGARMTGVDLADRFIQIAFEQEAAQPLSISYHQGSAADLSYLRDSSFDKVVANYVLMDLKDLRGTLQEVHRVLRPGGLFVVVISHPSLGGGPGGWVIPAPDSPRLEDRFAFQVDSYFIPGPTYAQWGEFDPVPGFHRTLSEYWRTFRKAGFRIDDYLEPSLTMRRSKELPISRQDHWLRIPYSCLFRLVRENTVKS